MKKKWRAQDKSGNEKNKVEEEVEVEAKRKWILRENIIKWDIVKKESEGRGGEGTKSKEKTIKQKGQNEEEEEEEEEKEEEEEENVK